MHSHPFKKILRLLRYFALSCTCRFQFLTNQSRERPAMACLSLLSNIRLLSSALWSTSGHFRPTPSLPRWHGLVCSVQPCYGLCSLKSDSYHLNGSSWNRPSGQHASSSWSVRSTFCRSLERKSICQYVHTLHSGYLSPNLYLHLLVLGGAQPLGYIGGLIIGGILCQSPVGWRSLFWVQAALGTIFTVMAWFCLPPDQNSQEGEQGANFEIMFKRLRRIDWVGAALSTTGLGLFTFSLAYVHILSDISRDTADTWVF